MKRFHDRFLLGSGSETIGLGFSWRSSSEPPSTGNGFVSGLSMTVNVPEQGVLLVNASAETFSDVIDAFGCGISTDGSPGTASAASWRTVDLTANFYDTCSTQTALAVNPGTRHIGLVISGAEPDTQVTSAAVTAVLLTNSGSFGLLSEPQADIEAPDIIDEKKGE